VLESFLGIIADRILASFGSRMEDLCLVFPTRRSKVYFIDELRKRQKEETFFLPQIVTFDALLEEMTGYRIADQSEIAWYLLSVCNNPNTEFKQQPDEVLTFGNILISDFNQTDLNLVDANWFIDYLSEAKALETWNPGKETLTDYQKNYLRFWKQSKSLYFELRKILEENQIGYQGILYRKAAENPVQETEKKFYWFCGFNALLPSEKKIIENIRKVAEVKLILDAEKELLNKDVVHGKFIRENLNIFKDIVDIIGTDEGHVHHQETSITGCPGNVAQIHALNKILLTDLNNPSDTAVVVNNPSLLSMLCSELSMLGIQYNLTGGMPAKNTTAFSFADHLLRLWSGKPLQKTSELLAETATELFGFISETDKRKRITEEQIKKLHSLSISVVSEIALSLQSVFSGIIEIFEEEESAEINADYACLMLFLKSANTSASLLINQPSLGELFQAGSFCMFFRQQLLHAHIQLDGNNREGIQLTGLLETRNLDFKRIVHLSCNEGNLPPDVRIPSFVPYDLQHEAGWLMQNEREHIYAYHFFRSCKRSTQIHLLYNTETDEMGSGEPSRFLRMIRLHQLHNKDRYYYKEHLASFGGYENKGSVNPTVIIKTPGVKKLIDAFTEGFSFSASSLNTLRKCSLRFYLRYICKVKEPPQEDVFLDSRTSGIIIHKIVEISLQSFVGQKIESAKVQLSREAIENIFNDFVKIEYEDKDFNSGEGMVQKAYLCDTALRLLEGICEIDNGVHLIGIEKEIELSEMMGDSKIKFVGSIDRVQERDGILEIVDYKTGKVDAGKLKINSCEEIGIHENRDQIFQLLFYTWLMRSEEKLTESSIVSTKENNFEKIRACFNTQSLIGKKETDSFEALIFQIIGDFLNPEIPISQTAEKANCKKCYFNTICHLQDDQAEDITG
jgi:ATP-dependent helicase/nuclease subunit B